MNDNNETCPVCGEAYNHYIDNGNRNGWPTKGGDVATVKFEVCTPEDSGYMYVHTEGVKTPMCGDGLADLQDAEDDANPEIVRFDGHTVVKGPKSFRDHS